VSNRFHTRILLSAFLLIAPVSTRAWTLPRRSVEYVRTVPTVGEFTRPRSIWTKLLNLVVGGPERPEITRPYSIAHDSVGRLLVADPGASGVHIFDFERQKYQFLRGPKGKTLESPMDVVCDTNDDIYVSDSVRRLVYVFDAKGKFLRSIGGTALLRPTGMALDRQTRRLYLTDTLRHQVLEFALNGSLLRILGKRGTGPGEFNFPTSLTVSGGRLYVVDAMNFRIQSFTADGQFAGSFGQPGDQSGTLNRPKGIAADTEGNLYVVDALFETVQVFDTQGRLLYYFGSTGTKPGQFQLPAGISIDNRNVIYVADSMNRRVQVFRRREQP
jgi:sugar lactone lactonase YvrE